MITIKGEHIPYCRSQAQNNPPGQMYSRRAIIQLRIYSNAVRASSVLDYNSAFKRWLLAIALLLARGNSAL